MPDEVFINRNELDDAEWRTVHASDSFLLMNTSKGIIPLIPWSPTKDRNI